MALISTAFTSPQKVSAIIFNKPIHSDKKLEQLKTFQAVLIYTFVIP